MKKRIALLALAAAAAAMLAGCGTRAPEQQTTEAQTQAKTEEDTEAVTYAVEPASESVVIELPTEVPVETEPATEKITEAETEVQFPDDLTADEEMEYETELPQIEVYYAADDLNVRQTPETESDNIIGSFEKGDEVNVIGVTPHWYRVSVEDWEGYVFGQNLSKDKVEPMTPEERDAAASAEAEAIAGSDNGASADVSSYAESFTIVTSGDANVRASGNQQADIVGTLSEGTTVTAIGESGDWYQVVLDDGSTGYVNKNLVLQ